VISSDAELYAIECAALAAVISSLLLIQLHRVLSRLRPDFHCGSAIAAALGIRFATVLAVATLGETGEDLRGPDDAAFLEEAKRFATEPIGLDWLTESQGDALTAVAALQLKLLGDPGAASVRFIQVGIAVAGLMLAAFGVHQLAGGRASTVTAWLLAVEPANVFFSSILHKEAILLFAGGLVLTGIAALWRQQLWNGLAWCAVGLIVAVSVRPYAAGCLLAGVGLVAAHLGLSRLQVRNRVIAIVCCAGVATALVVGVLSSSWGAAQLDRLQSFQRSQQELGNLPLEPVDVTSPSGLASAVPTRGLDLLTRPYPWQGDNLSQRLAVLGTLPAWALMIAIVAAVIRRRPGLVDALPVAYLLAAVTIGYALTTANAGTGFRHRTQVVVLLTAVAAIVWLHRDLEPRGKRGEERDAEVQAS
jgi:hypothetical protein